MTRLFARLRQQQTETKAAAFAVGALEVDAAFVTLDDSFDKIQAQPSAVDGIGFARFDAVERLEKLILLIVGDAVAVVDDFEQRRVVVAPETGFNRAAARRIFERIA